MNYDFVIIGAGPVGLTLATLLKDNFTILLIEKESYIGGCHGVKMVDNHFTEHGPRIYLDNYIMFRHILNLLGTDFYDLFVPYNFNIGDISKIDKIDLIKLSFSFMMLNKGYKKISLKTYLEDYNFSNKSKDYIDRICRLVDGGDSARFSLYNFLQITNQNSLYNVYQPKYPNNHTNGLFGIWQRNLHHNNVSIMLNATITRINSIRDKISSVVIDGKEIFGKNFIMAMPPLSIANLIKNMQIRDAFGPYDLFRDFAVKTNYIDYISVVFHWKDKLNLPKIWGFPSTSWGVAFIVLSDYMQLEGTVISTILTMEEPHNISNKDEIINETFRQLKESYNMLPMYDKAFIEHNKWNGNKWQSTNNAFLNSMGGTIKAKSVKYNNLWNCGTQNGKSNYNFTSMESAVVNAISLYNEIGDNKIKIKYPLELRNVIIATIFIILFVYIFWNM